MKIAEVTLQTRKFEAIRAFYGTVLGLDVLEERHSLLSFRVGESVLSFREGSPSENPFYHVAFTIPTNLFAEAKIWLRERSIPLFVKDGQDEFFFENWNATSLYYYDPDGNLIEFIAHHTLANEANEAFGPQHLLRISEIGLPVDDVPEAVRKLADTFLLQPWGGDGKQFAPLGDVEGLLIVVDKLRPWFPDGRLPAVFDTQIFIQGPGSASLLLQNGRYKLRS